MKRGPGESRVFLIAQEGEDGMEPEARPED